MTPEEFFAVLREMPAPVAQCCRLYHDDQGRVRFYSMEDLPGTWIEVDALTYAQARRDVRVIDGKVIEIPRMPVVTKLVPGNQGTACDPRDICLIVGQDHPHLKWSQQNSD